jgi:hypothetical protein
MTYIEMLLLIEEKQEHTLAHNVSSLITEKRRYLRADDATWAEDAEPGAPERRVGRGGEYFVWVRPELPLPEGLLSKETLADVIAKTKGV